MISGKRITYVLKIAVIATSCFALTGCKTARKAAMPERVENDVHVSEIIKNYRLSDRQKRILAETTSWLGTPYKYAHAEKGEGTDCSGMVMMIYQNAAGCKLPRNSAKQAEFCTRISNDEVCPGDLVFFATGDDPNVVNHVGIMIDDVRFVHASASKGVVISKLEGSYYPPRFKMYGRIPMADN